MGKGGLQYNDEPENVSDAHGEIDVGLLLLVVVDRSQSKHFFFLIQTCDVGLRWGGLCESWLDVHDFLIGKKDQVIRDKSIF